MNHTFRQGLVFIALCAIAGCVTSQLKPGTIDWRDVDTKNACMVNAVGFRNAKLIQARLRGVETKVQILIVGWDTSTTKGAHAVVMFEDGDTIWVYDSANPKGSWPLTKDPYLWLFPNALAELWAPNTSIRYAYFADDVKVDQYKAK